ncbi:MAG: hypothetical protein Q4F58_02265 [Candidatus Saccharibacteria bacterium]|nr:hypothetical protein [Candidatus Saccharibacteria bacterium]
MKKKTPLIIALATITIAIIAILVKMFTLETEVELVQTITMPALPVISEMQEGDFKQKAIAIDDNIIQGTNQNPQPTASTAKMILGLAIMEKKPFNQGETGETITITPEFYNRYLWYINNHGSVTAVKTGEEINQYDALVSVFLASSNNMADTLAIWAFGNLEDYRTYATEMLDRIGVKNTTIGTDASGYSETTTSTAEDLAIIANKLLENPVLREIVGLKSHTVPVAGTIENTNKILGDDLNNNATVIGVKTGYIGSISGYNLISAYQIENHFVTLAVLGSTTRQASFTESKNELLRLTQELTPTTIVKTNEKVGYYQTWWSGQHEISATEGITVLAPEENNSNLELEDQILKATINGEVYTAKTEVEDFAKAPTFVERFLHLFGWHNL